jgi:large subunit ribosomal protein L27
LTKKNNSVNVSGVKIINRTGSGRSYPRPHSDITMVQLKTSGGKKGRDKLPKYLGIKISDGEKAKTGNIIIRQRGTKFVAGKNARRGNDDTIYAVKEGKVSVITKKKLGFNNIRKEIKIVNVD